MEYPNLPERKLIDIPANSRASRGTCKFITTQWSETKPSKLAPQCASTFIWMKRPQTIWSSAFIWTKISSTYVSFHSRYNMSPNKKSSIVQKVCTNTERMTNVFYRSWQCFYYMHHGKFLFFLQHGKFLLHLAMANIVYAS